MSRHDYSIMKKILLLVMELDDVEIKDSFLLIHSKAMIGRLESRTNVFSAPLKEPEEA